MTALPDPIADRKTNTVVIGQMLASSFLWASAFLLLKIIGGDLSPMVLTAARGVMGGGLLAGWLLILGQTLRPQGREWRDWPILGLLQGSIPNVLTAYALSQITTGLSAMIQASTPLLVAVIAHGLFADERLTARRGLGVLVGFAGMALLIGPTAFAGGQVGLFGVLAMAGTALSYAIGNVYIRTIPAQQPLRLAFGQQTLAGLPTLAVVLATGGLGGLRGGPRPSRGAAGSRYFRNRAADRSLYADSTLGRSDHRLDDQLFHSGLDRPAWLGGAA